MYIEIDDILKKNFDCGGGTLICCKDALVHANIFWALIFRRVFLVLEKKIFILSNQWSMNIETDWASQIAYFYGLQFLKVLEIFRVNFPIDFTDKEKQEFKTMLSCGNSAWL